VSALGRSAIEFTKHTGPVPSAHLLFGSEFFPTVPEFCQNCGERDELGLAGQITI
jgi:hypothetical protein